MNTWAGSSMRRWVGLAAAVLLAAATGCATSSKATAGSKTRDAGAKTDTTVSQREPSVKTLYAMARILRSQGKSAEEEAVLRSVLAKEPRFVPAYVDLAEIRMRQHLYTEAKNELNGGLAVAPDDPVLLNDLGVCALLQDDHEEALRCFARASEVAPGEVRYRSNKALALGLLGRYEESDALYRQALSPDDAAHNLAVIKDMRGEAGGDTPAVVQEDLPPTVIVPEVTATDATQP